MDTPERVTINTHEAPPFRTKVLNVGILASLAAVALLIGGRDIGTGGFSWSDAPLHAMDGVFVNDLLCQRPTVGLREWAEQYYLKHQCLSIVVYYPPLFAASEAVVFLLLGVSVFTARLTVLIFVIGTLWLIYAFTRNLFGTIAGIAASIMLLTCPAGITWSRQVMLEWPAVFFIILTLLAYWRYLNRPTWTGGTLTAMGVLAAYLTKQTAAFVLMVIVLHACGDRRWRQLLRRSFTIPIIVAVLIITAYSLATAGYNKLAGQLIVGPNFWERLTQTDTWTWYVLRLPAIIGWPLLIGILLAGVILVIESGGKAGTQPADKQALSLILIWLVLWWLICSVSAAKEERYFFFAAPAIAIIIAGGLNRLNGRRSFGIGTVTLIILCGLQLFIAVRHPTCRLPTTKPTIDYLLRQGDADLVLIDAVRDGEFIFDVRTSPEAQDRIIPMRASKFLYSRAARTRYDYKTHIHTPTELLDWLDRYGIHYVVIEDRLPETSDQSWDTPPRIMLREVLGDTNRFARVFTQSLAGDDPAWRDVQLVTYRYLEAKPRTSNMVTVHIPAMGRDISLRLPLKSTSNHLGPEKHQK